MGHAYLSPVDGKRMRYLTPTLVDRAWIDHSFAWKWGPDGTDTLAERPGFPLLARPARSVPSRVPDDPNRMRSRRRDREEG